MRGVPSRLIADNGGAVASTVALSLFALIAIGGVAFDYARMASLDTELQNAADQAALAAASQLDGLPGACSRAATAARAMITNRTLMANDGGGTAIAIADETACDATGSVRFYEDIAKTMPADSDVDAKFVEIRVDSRVAFYALTPIVAAFSSGQLSGIAFAGLGSAICRVPPLMMCNPNEGADPDFTVANYVGKGIRLVGNDGGGFYGPGTFGFLDVGAGGGASILRAALGRNAGPGDCVAATGVDVEPGNIITVRDALNTRFDVIDNGLNQACGATGALCPPSLNSRKDLLKGSGGGNNSCGFQTGNGNVGWRLPDAAAAYLPTSAAPLTAAQLVGKAPMGYPRDMCHAVSVTGTCPAGRVGNGEWDRNAYFVTNSSAYSTPPTSSDYSTWFGTQTPSRYQVYQYEMQNAATRLVSQQFSPTRMAHGQPVCTPPGVTPTATQIDRRVLSVAMINCAAQSVGSNSKDVRVEKFIDIFLVEPAVTRPNTENADIYVEIIGNTLNATDEGAVQLVKKSVPYLIE